jgi:hypothetical protein
MFNVRSPEGFSHRQPARNSCTFVVTTPRRTTTIGVDAFWDQLIGDGNGLTMQAD